MGECFDYGVFVYESGRVFGGVPWGRSGAVGVRKEERLIGDLACFGGFPWLVNLLVEKASVKCDFASLAFTGLVDDFGFS